MKQKINGFLERKVTMERLLTACFASFLGTIALFLIWLILMSGGFWNMVSTLKFSQILGVIDRVYIGQANTQQIADTAFATMIDSLDDRWSYYMNREDYQRYRQAQKNSYMGVGITIRQEEQGMKILSVAKNSPAEKAGVQGNTWLVEVNGVRLTTETTGEVGQLIRENSDDICLVTADDDGKETTYRMTMETIYSNPVSYEMKDGEIGYIQIANFDETCAKEAIHAVDDLMEQGAKGLVFDVRNNGGGLVSQLCELLDYLLPAGEIFVSVDERGKESVTKSDSAFVGLPMIVMVNENSYSAAEFFAAALREYDAALIAGAQTTGKNRSQTNVLLADGSAVHISSKRYLTPNRIDLTEQGGLTPDLVVEDGENDPQLAAALAQIQKTIVDCG